MWTEDEIVNRLRVNDGTVSILCSDEANEIAGTFEELRKERDEWREECLSHKRKVETLREALEKIKRVPSVRYTSGHLHDCAWCNGSADIACAALAETEKK